MTEPQLNFAILCETAFVDKEEKLSIIQTFNTINAEDTPILYPKMVVVTNYQFDKDYDDFQFNQLVNIRDPQDKVIAELPINRKGAKESTQFLSFFHGVEFKKFGTYDIEILLGKKLIKTLHLEVKKI
jgi:hypothetical protein